MASQRNEPKELRLTDSISVPDHPAGTSGVNTSVDCSSDTATAQDLEIKFDDALLEGIRQGRKDSVYKFLAVALKLITGKDTISEQFDYILNQKLSEFIDEKSDIPVEVMVDLLLLLSQEEKWKKKFKSLYQSVQGPKNIINELVAMMLTNPQANAIKSTRTVGLQVDLIPRLKHKHPAPPPTYSQKNWASGKRLPPAPALTLKKQQTKDGQELVLTWTLNNPSKACTRIKRYQIYCYHEVSNEAPNTDTWKEICNLKALPLPMACTLDQLIPGEKYHFVIRAIDKLNRYGPFCSPECQYMD